MAERPGPEQSAPTACGTRLRGFSGCAGQSASASFSSLELPIRLDEWPAREVARARKPWFYLRLGVEAGLTLVRVLRRGLELGECLGLTADRANEDYETALRTFVPVSGAAAEGIILAAASRYQC